MGTLDKLNIMLNILGGLGLRAMSISGEEIVIDKDIPFFDGSIGEGTTKLRTTYGLRNRDIIGVTAIAFHNSGGSFMQIPVDNVDSAFFTGY